VCAKLILSALVPAMLMAATPDPGLQKAIDAALYGIEPAQAGLAHSGGASHDQFGAAVAIDGAIVAMAAPETNNGDGAVYIFTQSQGTWTQLAKLSPPNGLTRSFYTGGFLCVHLH
jgi:FG-GAP repeat protein